MKAIPMNCRIAMKMTTFAAAKKKHNHNLHHEIMLKERELTQKILKLYEDCLGVRLTMTRQLSKFMTAASRWDKKLIHTLELINRIGINTRFHQKQRSNCIEILKRVSRKLNDFDRKMDNSFAAFDGKVDMCAKYVEDLNKLIERFEKKSISFTELAKKMPALICCQLNLPIGSHHCGDHNNNMEEPEEFDLEFANHVLKQDWKCDMTTIENIFIEFKQQYISLCSLYSIKDDWDESDSE